MRDEIVRAAIVALGPECRISAEELALRLALALEEYRAWTNVQEMMPPPRAVRRRWQKIYRHVTALLTSLDVTADGSASRNSAPPKSPKKSTLLAM
jgi:hypothetical protein